MCFSGCQVDWVSFGQSCYHFGHSEAAITWHTAVDKCSENRSHLVHIKSLEVTDFIHTLVWQRQLSDNEAVYIGKCCIPTLGRIHNLFCFWLFFLISLCHYRPEWRERRKCVALGWWYSCDIFQLVCRKGSVWNVERHSISTYFNLINCVIIVR